MELTAKKNPRRGLRFVCAFISLLIFGYLVEIFIMGAPDFRRHSNRSYHHERDPVPFWSQFTVFAIVGVAAAYLSIDWKKGLSLIETAERHDQATLASMPHDQAKKIGRRREYQVAALMVPLGLILGLLLLLLLT